jgi:hypothetical protein
VRVGRGSTLHGAVARRVHAARNKPCRIPPNVRESRESRF